MGTSVYHLTMCSYFRVPKSHHKLPGTNHDATPNLVPIRHRPPRRPTRARASPRTVRMGTSVYHLTMCSYFRVPKSHHMLPGTNHHATPNLVLPCPTLFRCPT